MRRLTLAVGSAAGALALAATGSLVFTSPSPASPVRLSADARLTAQKIAWKPCVDPADFPSGEEFPALFKRFDCGTMTVPLDWAAPAKGRLKVAVSRLRPVSGRAKGVVFTNPGGPGGPGLELPLSFADMNGRSKLADAMQIVGIDVRGTGDSSTVTCGPLPYRPLDPRNRSKANVAKLLKDASAVAKACQGASGARGRYITTWQTVRDLDLLRSLLGQQKVHWIGYSGGSWLGAHYATAFPKRTGRFVLDSNVDFTGTWQQAFARQPLGFERRFRQDFAPWAANYNRKYGLGKNAAQVRRTYEAIRANLARNPLPMLSGPDLHAVELDGLITQGMYSKYEFSEVARVLSVLRRYTGVKVRSAAAPADLARSIEKLRKRWSPLRVEEEPAWDADTATFYSVTCNDTPRTGTVKNLVARSAKAGRAYPLVGYAMISDPCQHWKRPKVKALPKVTGKGVPPVLMVQSTHDPATPYEGALNAHRRFAGSRMLTVTREGDHGLYASGNNCVDRVVENYIVNGVLPKKDLSCKGTGMPAPDEMGPFAQSSDRLPGNVLERAQVLSERYRLRG
ncbi:alpha/beta hydrolase [Actinomadura hibisca]|uniref:alpha/beta hydrolase n=1 Tax=Actinomadura hibisca TaxID=68565 RepID=UPI000830E4E5|nr:alpha/beta hydrolase [Actinomadura hibisca]